MSSLDLWDQLGTSSRKSRKSLSQGSSYSLNVNKTCSSFSIQLRLHRRQILSFYGTPSYLPSFVDSLSFWNSGSLSRLLFIELKYFRMLRVMIQSLCVCDLVELITENSVREHNFGYFIVTNRNMYTTRNVI